MFKKLLLALIAFVLSAGFAFAAVDINSADEAGLDAIKGVGPAKAKAIVDERKKNGPFKSLDDVAARVKGIGEKTVAGWKKDGSVTVGGGSGAPAPAAKAEAKKDTAKADAKKDAPKAEEKKADAKKDAPKADAKKDDKKEDKKADKK